MLPLMPGDSRTFRRNKGGIPTTILLAAILSSFLVSCSKPQATQPAMPKFTELSPEDRTRLDMQRAIVATAAKQRYGTPALTHSRADLPVIQRLIDDQAFSKNQTYELQSLGVVLGDVLVAELPLKWVMVTDEFGTDPTLRFKDSTLQVNVLTMISKRIEQDREANVADLLRKTQEQLERLAADHP